MTYEELQIKLCALESSIELLKKYFGNRAEIPHRAMEIAFGWDALKEEEQ